MSLFIYFSCEAPRLYFKGSKRKNNTFLFASSIRIFYYFFQLIDLILLQLSFILDVVEEGAHTRRAFLGEDGRQGLANTVIHWSSHTESRSWSRQDPALSVWTPMYYRVYQTLPSSQPASFS